MSKRHLLLGVVFGLVALLAGPSLQAETSSILDVFFWLLVLLVAAGLALWPSAAPGQGAEVGLERRGWADRIKFEARGGPLQRPATPE
jgi:hypothetical protein